MLTREQKRLAKRAFKQVGWLEEMVNCLVDDPMTDAVGAPVGDITMGWRRTHLRRLKKLHDECLNNGLGQMAFRLACEMGDLVEG